MNKIYQYILLVVLLPMLSACDSLFDNELPPHNLTGENAITNESSAEVALNGIYSYVQGYGSMVAYYISDNEFRCGLLNPANYYRSIEKDQLPEFKIEVENSDVQNPWAQYYKIVNSANNFIYYVERLSDGVFGPGRKTQMLAEARFMRAFAHAGLLRKYGYFWDINSKYGPIVRLESSVLSNNEMPRSSVAETYRCIFEDLDYAIQKGPEFYSVYRSCATTAKAFKADILMNRGAEGDYAEAIRLADEVIGSSEFGMEEKYVDVFQKGYASKELLFSRYLKNPPSMEQNSGTLLKMFGGGTYQPSEYYISVFPKEDSRYQVTFDSLEFSKLDGTKYKQLIWKKHNRGEDKNCPMYYMRVAQMYLIKAEAMLWNGSEMKDVVEVLNVLRSRSENSLFKVSDYADREALMKEIFDENLREIGMENGAMYYLAVRMKQGGQRLLKMLNDNYNNDDQLCFPVPQAELDHNTQVEQKPL